MARILVTGGTGYIGSHTTVELMQQGYDVVIVDNLSNSNADVLDGIEAIVGTRPPFEQVDCNDAVAMADVFARYPDIFCKVIYGKGIHNYLVKLVIWHIFVVFVGKCFYYVDTHLALARLSAPAWVYAKAVG